MLAQRMEKIRVPFLALPPTWTLYHGEPQPQHLRRSTSSQGRTPLALRLPDAYRSPPTHRALRSLAAEEDSRASLRA